MILCLQRQYAAARAAHPRAVIFCRDTRTAHLPGVAKPMLVSRQWARRAEQSPNAQPYRP